MEQAVIIGASAAAGSLLLVFLLLNFVLLPQGHEEKRKEQLKSRLLKNVIITGGSSGIGLAVARELIQNGCKSITLLARGLDKLNEAKNLLQADAESFGNNDAVISIYSVDVGNVDAVKEAAKELCTDGESTKAPSIIFNVAGTSKSGSFLDTDPKEFERLMTINYFGSVNVTHSFLPYMLKKEKKAPGVIVFTSSAAGQVGVYGFSAYSPTKYALRGLAEVLQMETLRDNIFVQVAYPPDTDTPGYEAEQVGKPEETHLISETAGLFKAEDVAKKMVSSALQRRPNHSVYFGLEGWMLATLTAGMSPVHTIIDALCQICLMGLLRFISLFYLMDFRRILHRVARQKEKNEGKKAKTE